ncbi:IQ domain-containing protein H [Bombina bombina]|uniref:IQ domain-containing protein H n=1 Tax=Bombina bombina TaxID=8345 RepID=UPI00235AAEFF|nr:IQ domain-containing protein H [Bombina bombina]
MAGFSGGTDPVGRLLVQVQDDLQHLKNELTHAIIHDKEEVVDIHVLEKAIQRTKIGLKKHTEDYLHYISCNPLTLPYEGNRDKYTPKLLKWGHHLEAGKQKKPLLDSTDIRLQLAHAPGFTNVISPGQQHKLSLSTRIMCNPENITHRGLLSQNFGISLPLISCRQKISLPHEKIIRGNTVANLAVLPASHRMDASLPPPPVQEKDVQTGLLSLMQRGLIPQAAQLTLDPPAVLSQTLALHSGKTPRVPVLKEDTVKDFSKMAVTSVDIERTHKTKSYATRQSHTQLQRDRCVTPYPSTQHSASAKRVQTPVSVIDMDLQRDAPTHQMSYLTATPMGDRFTIYSGVIDTEAADFLAFKQQYCLCWGSFLSFLESLQKLLLDYAVPAAVVEGEKLRLAVLEQELGVPPSVSQLLSVLENKSWVQRFLNQPGQRYRGREGKHAAAVKIQATWRGYRDRTAYLFYQRQRWAAGIIAISWLLHLQKSRVRKMLQTSRDHYLNNYHCRIKHLVSNWKHIRMCRRSIIHIPSLGYTEKQRAQTSDLHIQQNLQIGRLCDIADPNVDVIYVCPVELDEEMQQYYRKLLGLRAAVLAGNPKDASDLHERFTIVIPEAVGRFPNHHMCLSTLLKYSPKALIRIRNLIRGREAYMVSGVPHADDLAVADMLDIPILGSEPKLAHLYSTKSGSKRIFASAGIATAPGEYDIYTQQQFLDALGQLIINNLQVTRWLFKVDDEFGGNGTAFFDIAAHLPSFEWALSEMGRYGPDTWKQKWAQEKVLLRIMHELPQILEKYAQVVNKKRFSTWDKFLQHLVSRGGVIEAFPPAESITCLTVDLLIEPDGEIKIMSCGDQIHSPGPLQSIGTSVPQCSVSPNALTSICTRIGEVCRTRGMLGYLSVDLLTFIDHNSLEQQIWATDLDLCYSDQLAMTNLMLYLTNGTLDCTNSRLDVPPAPSKMECSRHRAQSMQTAPNASRVAVLSTRLLHTNLSVVYYSVFFQMCRAHGIGYDVKEKQGTVFVLLENQKRHRLGMLTIAEDLQGALMTFAHNLFIIHQEISAPNMQGETNFKETVQEIEDILGVAEENKLKFEKDVI